MTRFDEVEFSRWKKMLLSHIESVISGGEGNSVRIRLQRTAFIKKILDYCQTFNDKSKKKLELVNLIAVKTAFLNRVNGYFLYTVQYEPIERSK